MFHRRRIEFYAYYITNKLFVKKNERRKKKNEKYSLEKRTGVDFQRFSQNRMSRKALCLGDKKVFPEGKARFTLSNRGRDRALFHTGVIKRQKKRSN